MPAPDDVRAVLDDEATRPSTAPPGRGAVRDAGVDASGTSASTRASDRDPVAISLDPARVQLDVVYPWLRDSYWSPGIRRDVVERAFAHSIVAGAYVDSVQVGVARVVTDEATFAWLCDVFVAPAARGHGIATRMVRALVDDPRLQTVRRWALGTRDAHAVYRPFGFAPVDPAVHMQWLPDPSRWR